MTIALRHFIFLDVLCLRYPHHDEEAAEQLPKSEHGRLHIQAAIWWSMRSEAPRARYEWSEAHRLGELSERTTTIYAFHSIRLQMNEMKPE